MDIEGNQPEQVMLQRDIKVNNRELANLNDIVSEFRSEFRDIRQRLDKHDNNMNLNLPIIAECPGGLALPQYLLSQNARKLLRFTLEHKWL